MAGNEFNNEWLRVFPTLNEAQKRWVGGILSSEIGFGGGRKNIQLTDEKLLQNIKNILEQTTAGDPMSSIKWTCKSVRKMTEELSKQGHSISYRTTYNLLKEMGYSLQSNKKSLSRENNPDRDRQFKMINRRVKKFLAADQPVISVDTKKKEMVGKFKNQGRNWRPKGDPILVEDHDFLSRGEGGEPSLMEHMT